MVGVEIKPELFKLDKGNHSSKDMVLLRANRLGR